MPEDTRRGSRGSSQTPSRWSSPENSKASSDFLVHTILILTPEGSIMASASGQCSHLAVGEVEVVTHLHGQRALAAAAEAHDAVLAASVRHVVNCEYSLTSRVRLRNDGQFKIKIMQTLLGSARVGGCSHHYEPEVVSVGIAVICTLDFQFVSSHSTNLHLMDLPGNIK